MTETYSRQQLYDLVWSGPMRDVSKKLSLSDNGLRKHCVKAFVPLPPQGYWNKLRAGQKPKVIALPPRPPGVSDTISFGQWNYLENNRKLLESEPVAPIFVEPIEAVRARVSRNIGIVVASKNLTPAHAAFRRQYEDDARRAAESTWYTAIFNDPLENRRLRILQGLFYGLSRLDCDVTVQGREVRTIYVRVGQQNVQIMLDKATAQRRGGAPEKEEGRLKFSVAGGGFHGGERMSWADADGEPLEKHLSAIAVEIIIVGEMQYREHLEWAYEESIRRREEMKQEALQRKLAEEKAQRDRLKKLAADRLKRLTDSAENHQKAESIRAFVAHVGEMAADQGESEEVRRWREWALGQADMLDPIKTGRIWKDIEDS